MRTFDIKKEVNRQEALETPKLKKAEPPPWCVIAGRVRTRAQDRALDWESDSRCSWAGNGSSKAAHLCEQLLLT